MSDQSSIEWTDATWNPVRGCTKVSPGCANCYAETFAERFRGVKGHAYEQGFDLRLVPEKLTDPLKWKSPRRIFVNSMSDLFQEGVPLGFTQQVFDVMVACPQHTFQILTKRPHIAAGFAHALPWPSNVWLGVSVENQHWKSRIDILRETPAIVRFLSIEPLLEDIAMLDLRGIHWVIVGGESGHSARPFNVDLARSIVAQCRAAGVPCFVKQLGAVPVICRDVSGVFVPDYELRLKSKKGCDMAEWPKDLRVREFPEVA